MSVIVEFESFPVKKCTIKTTPAMSIQSITTQACTALKLDPPDAYQLQLKKQILQPSLSFRLAGISSGSKLQLIYRGVSSKSQNVTIALQTEESGRVVDVFDSSVTLWEMLLHFEKQCSINLTRKSGIPPKKSTLQTSNPVYIMPVCVFMNKEYSNLAVLKNTTFADLGLSSGNGSIRLLEQFTSSCIEAYTKEIEANPPKKALVDVTVVPVRSEKSTKPANYEKKSATVNQVILSPPQAAQPKELPQSTHYLNVDNPDERPDVAPDVKVYKPAPEGASPANIQLPASFYSLNSSELKVLIDGQKATLNSLQNRPLMTKSLREREQRLREQKYPKTMVRVRFPDRYVLEATFYSGDKVESLFKLVAENLATHGSFRLYVTPPQTDLNPSLTFWKSKLAPASLIHFAHGDSSPGLIQSLLDGAADYPVPGTVITPATADVDEEGPAVEIEAERSRYQSASASSKVPDEERKTPKWFRLGK